MDCSFDYFCLCFVYNSVTAIVIVMFCSVFICQEFCWVTGSSPVARLQPAGGGHLYPALYGHLWPEEVS